MEIAVIHELQVGYREIQVEYPKHTRQERASGYIYIEREIYISGEPESAAK